MKSFLKPLSTKEEQSYLSAYKSGDVYAREVLIERNLRLVAHIVKKYSKINVDTEDLISIGTIGLIKAVDSFNMEKGIRLATYASCCIENELLMFFRSEKKKSKDVYMWEPIGSDKEGNEIFIFDILQGKSVDVIEQMTIQENIKKLYIFMKNVLSKREQEILMLRYGLFGKQEKTQREIAQKYGISRSYVSRIEKKALKSLKKCYESDEKKNTETILESRN
ncbi:MAG: RNA polymerase sporulation sigma factor SigK [Lachnospiraceae bacterium]|nr:RNA polymerase sporulation sigma factor SigK [Lachnospiraceae bacterium]